MAPVIAVIHTRFVPNTFTVIAYAMLPIATTGTNKGMVNIPCKNAMRGVTQATTNPLHKP